MSALSGGKDLVRLKLMWRMDGLMYVLKDSFQWKMTDVLVADHNRSMHVITGEP